MALTPALVEALRQARISGKHAAMLSVVTKQVANWIVAQTSVGRPFDGELRYFFLGAQGELAEEITAEHFEGQEGDRLPGLYAVVPVNEAGTETLSSAWVGVLRERGMVVGRERTADSGWGDLLEEYRTRLSEQRRENDRANARKDKLSQENAVLVDALDKTRREKLNAEIERDAAVTAAAEMEHERDEAVRRCEDLQEEVDSFEPHIKMMVDQIADRFGPMAANLLGMAAGEDGFMGSVAATAAGFGGGGANGASVAGAANANGQASQEPREPSDSLPMEGPLVAQALYEHLWIDEEIGKFMTIAVVPEHRIQWAVIRGLVYGVTGIDLGVVPQWPSDVAKKAEDEAAAEGGAQGGGRNGGPNGGPSVPQDPRGRDGDARQGDAQQGEEG